MTDSIMYHEGNRRLQDQFDSRRISDRLESFARTEFTADDRAFIERAPYFFLATADAKGRPDCSFKGGMPGFVSVTGPSELAFPDYDGNGMFKSLGNILVNVEVGLLFIALHGRPQRLRVNGTATVSREDPDAGGDDGQRDGRSEDRDGQALGRELTKQAAARGPDGEADRELTRARRAPGEEQRGDVDAGNADDRDDRRGRAAE